MSETPLDPQPGRTPMPATDIGDDEEAIPGIGPVDNPQPPEGDGDETGGPDTQLSPTKD